MHSFLKSCKITSTRNSRVIGAHLILSLRNVVKGGREEEGKEKEEGGEGREGAERGIKMALRARE